MKNNDFIKLTADIADRLYNEVWDGHILGADEYYQDMVISEKASRRAVTLVIGELKKAGLLSGLTQ